MISVTLVDTPEGGKSVESGQIVDYTGAKYLLDVALVLKGSGSVKVRQHDNKAIVLEMEPRLPDHPRRVRYEFRPHGGDEDFTRLSAYLQLTW